MNGSVEGLLSRTFADNPFFHPLLDAPEFVRPASRIIGIAIALLATIAVWRDSSSQRVDRAFVILGLTALLVTPLGWIYYLWIVAGPMCALYQMRGLRVSSLCDALIALAI